MIRVVLKVLSFSLKRAWAAWDLARIPGRKFGIFGERWDAAPYGVVPGTTEADGWAWG